MTITFPDKVALLTVFVVKAFRFTTEHEYIVEICLSRKEAETAAENEVANRGGKYSCGIYECEINSIELVKTVLSHHHKINIDKV